jgi:hypothetical protein
MGIVQMQAKQNTRPPMSPEEEAAYHKWLAGERERDQARTE